MKKLGNKKLSECFDTVIMEKTFSLEFCQKKNLMLKNPTVGWLIQNRTLLSGKQLSLIIKVL